MFSDFCLEGVWFAAMDSGAKEHEFSFNEAISFMVNCENQEEIDYFWEKLSAFRESEQCGWLKDKFGVSWQIVPSQMSAIMPDPVKSDLVMAAMTGMKKLDMNKLMAAAK